MYDAAGEDDPDWRDRYRSLLIQYIQGNRLIDIGCGTGFDLRAFQNAGLATVGVDSSESMLRIARGRSPATKLIKADFRRLAQLSLRCDAIWSMFGLVHLPPDEIQECFLDWGKCLEGRGAIWIGLAQSSKSKQRVVKDWLGIPDNSVVFFYHSAEWIIANLKSAGFRVVHIWHDTPIRYQTPHYKEIGLESFVVYATKISPA